MSHRKTERLILAGDLGGTKTRLGLYRDGTRGLEPVHEEIFQSRDFEEFSHLLSAFLRKRPGASIRKICLGVPGPVQNGRCKTTNLPWVLDEREIVKSTGAETAKLLNDLQAAAYGVTFLSPGETLTLTRGLEADPQGNIAVIAPGTGLGEGFLCWTGGRYLPVASEGGHTDFAPQADLEIALLRYLMGKFGHVSYERVVSGPGLVEIYQFLRDTGRIPEPDWLREQLQQADPGVVITEVALADGHPLCVEALDLFVSLFGAEAGNLALKVLATGGVFLGGGIAPKILPRLQDGRFLKSFVSKGRYRELLERIPVSVVLNTKLPLIGAAHFARNL